MSATLIYGDCLKAMKDISDKSIDMILCDLPYGRTIYEWDKCISFDLLWKEYERIIKDKGVIALFGIEPFSSALRMSNLKLYKYDIYWQKERATNVFQLKRRPGKVIETISIFYKKQCTYNPQMIKYDGIKRTNKVKDGKLGILIDNGTKKPIEYQDMGWRYPLQIVQFQRDILRSNLHPTQKPVALCEYLIKTYTNQGDVVLDNCMGSGTTGVACANTKRDFIGIEINEEYFDVASQRLKQTPTLFE